MSTSHEDGTEDRKHLCKSSVARTATFPGMWMISDASGAASLFGVIDPLLSGAQDGEQTQTAGDHQRYQLLTALLLITP